MENSGIKIIFDENPKDLISVFVRSDVARFGILQFAKMQTLNIMQSFVSEYIGEQSKIPMYIQKDGTVTITPDENTTLTFGSFILKNENPSHLQNDSDPFVYINAEQTDGKNFSEKTIEVYPPKSAESYYNKPDYIICSDYKTDGYSEQSSEKSCYVYNNKIEEIMNFGTPEELCNE